MTGYKDRGRYAQLFKLFEGPGVSRSSETAKNIWPAQTLNKKKGSLQSAAVLVLLIDHLNGILFIDHLKEHEVLSLSVPDYRPHSHDLNVSVDVTEEGKGSEFNEKLYTKIKVEDLKEALSRAHILKEVK